MEVDGTSAVSEVISGVKQVTVSSITDTGNKGEPVHSQQAARDVALPIDVQQEIEDLCHFVPEVSQHFNIINKIGEGTFSSVFLARLKHHPEVEDMFALKHVIPTSHPNRILGELRCLQLIGGLENVMGLELCLRNKDHIVIVMRYFPHHKFQDYLPAMSLEDVREYMQNLLVALQRVHQFDIIHRDIKPSNFLHNTTTKQYALVDFGLAHDAPVKLQEANKGKSPIIVEHSMPAPQKENISKHADKSTANTKSRAADQDGPMKLAKESVESQVKPDKAVLSPSKQHSPNKQVSASPRKSAKSPGKKVSSFQAENRKGDETIFSPPSAPPPPRSSHSSAPTHLIKGREPLSPTKNRQLTVNPPDLLGHNVSKRGQPSPRRILLAHRAHAAHGEAGKKRGVGVPAEKHFSVAKRSSQHPHSQPTPLATCQCFGRPMICSICNARTIQSAPRAGTPGFRAPEVLMKHPLQTTAVDMWSAGVIFLSLLSGRYPFFRANDDLTCLSQIISILGTEEVQKAAQKYGKHLTCRPVTRPLDLKNLCLRLRAAPPTGKDHSTPVRPWPDIPDSAIDLLRQLLDPNPFTRITAEKALQHAFFTA